MSDSQPYWDARHRYFLNQIRDPFRPTRLRLDSVLQNDFIWFLFLHEICSPVCVNEFRFLNRLISISEGQDIPVWISSVKAENPAAKRILARVCKSDSRSKWDQNFTHNTFLESLTCILQLRLSPPSHFGTLTWQKTCHKKLGQKHKMQNFLSFNN
jgi:hypothetical protein